MKRTDIRFKLKQGKFLLLVLVIAGCSLEKKNGLNRNLQNLTAHYNILFNANQLILQKQQSNALGFVDAFTEILRVYPDTSGQAGADKDMDAAIEKAYKVINFKEQSHYQGDAYIVLGKSNYLEENYFNSGEFFSYVVSTFPKEPRLTQEAREWRARGLMNINDTAEAKLVLDTALMNVNPKKQKKITSDIYATKMQYDIYTGDYADAETMGKQALKYCTDIDYKLRWTFILGQLQELNQKPNDAVVSYTRIVKSNASFETAFNASLNIIRIQDMRNGIKISRIDLLLSLLKNPNNKDFKDQIYFQAGEIYSSEKDYDKAIKYYKLSVRNSTKNQNQKGLSYLRIADIDFKYKLDYVNAKKYYDSTLFNLSKGYKGYQFIKRKSDNLKLLTDKLEIISTEDTLQALAKLDDKTRARRIDALVSRKILASQADTAATTNNDYINKAENPQGSVPNGNNFYFYNSSAVSQGLSDFKRRWGSRKLEDNWRRSNRSNSDLTTNTSTASQSTDPDAPQADNVKNSKTALTAGKYRQDILQNLPLTPELLAASNLRIYNAYLDIANFYRDILQDNKEAINTYELLLTMFPDNNDKPAIYYSLYRLYSDIDPAKSEYYKNKILKDYPETTFSKVISDPEYSKKLDDENSEFDGFYNAVYDLYAQRKYSDVITRSDQLLKQFPTNKFAVQLYYLRALAEGHSEKLLPFSNDLQEIVTKFPNDRLVTPLVQQHQAYIIANQAELAQRPVILVDDDPNAPQFVPETVVQTSMFATVADKRKPVVILPVLPKPKAKDSVKTVAAVVAKPIAADSVKTVTPELKSTDSLQATAAVTPAIIKPKMISSIFSENDSTNYYFVVNVFNNTTNLASSRFGIGQFDRSTFQGSNLKHLLKDVGGNNELIYVGRFYTLPDAKDYARAIIPLMPEIMKIPKEKYNFFIITKQNLDKLADQKTLDNYIQYYQSNF